MASRGKLTLNREVADTARELRFKIAFFSLGVSTTAAPSSLGDMLDTRNEGDLAPEAQLQIVYKRSSLPPSKDALSSRASLPVRLGREQ
jgi:hypothetical protein